MSSHTYLFEKILYPALRIELTGFHAVTDVLSWERAVRKLVKGTGFEAHRIFNPNDVAHNSALRCLLRQQVKILVDGGVLVRVSKGKRKTGRTNKHEHSTSDFFTYAAGPNLHWHDAMLAELFGMDRNAYKKVRAKRIGPGFFKGETTT